MAEPTRTSPVTPDPRRLHLVFDVDDTLVGIDDDALDDHELDLLVRQLESAGFVPRFHLATGRLPADLEPLVRGAAKRLFAGRRHCFGDGALLATMADDGRLVVDAERLLARAEAARAVQVLATRGEGGGSITYYSSLAADGTIYGLHVGGTRVRDVYRARGDRRPFRYLTDVDEMLALAARGPRALAVRWFGAGVDADPRADALGRAGEIRCS